jgi:hypothetical protein
MTADLFAREAPATRRTGKNGAMRRDVIVLPLVALALCFASPAASAGQEEAAAFVAAPGFQIRDAGAIARATRRVGAGATPLERALTTLDALEAPIERLRYVVRRERRDGGAVELIEAARYNIGPSLRADAIKEYGADAVDTPRAFGIGPHVVWRFALTREGAIVAASRREAPEAAKARCPQGPCLSSEPLAQTRKWADHAAPAYAAPPRPYREILTIKDGGREVAPARVAYDLDAIATTLRAPGAEDGDEMVIERNLGQDAGADAALIFRDGARGRWLRCGYGVGPQGPARLCGLGVGPPPRRMTQAAAQAPAAPSGARATPQACAFYAAPRFGGARFILKADKPGRGVLYADAQVLPASVSGKVASALCAPGCKFFAHDREDHEGARYDGGPGARLPDLGGWSGRIRSVGVSCAP